MMTDPATGENVLQPIIRFHILPAAPKPRFCPCAPVLYQIERWNAFPHKFGCRSGEPGNAMMRRGRGEVG
jgi:hypothetical protein